MRRITCNIGYFTSFFNCLFITFWPGVFRFQKNTSSAANLSVTNKSRGFSVMCRKFNGLKPRLQHVLRNVVACNGSHGVGAFCAYHVK